MILTKYSSFSTSVMRKPMLTYMELPTINRQLLLVTNHHDNNGGGLSSFSARIVVKIVIYLNSRNEFIRTSFRGYRLLFRRI